MTIQETLVEFKETLKEISKNQTSILVELNRINHDLYGNGKKGFFDEFEECKKAIDIKIEEQKRIINIHSKYFWFLGTISSFVGGIITIIISAITNKYFNN